MFMTVLFNLLYHILNTNINITLLLTIPCPPFIPIPNNFCNQTFYILSCRICAWQWRSKRYKIW